MKQLTAKEVEIMLGDNKKLNIIDVRENEEVATGKIPGAIHIPLGQVAERLNELDSSKEYIMVCRSGNRSGRAAEFLASQEYSVINMAGGMMNWEGPTE